MSAPTESTLRESRRRAVGQLVGCACALAQLPTALAAANGTSTTGNTTEAGKAYGLLIAVSRPEALPRRLWLQGPANDAWLLSETLASLGVERARMQVLSDAPGGLRPTWSAVVEAMQHVLQNAQRGDLVVLHLAGHGVQTPVRQGAAYEPDGVDEVFVLADTGTWDTASNSLPRALYDDNIGDWMDSLVDNGVRVFGVFDTCHAAGMVRAASATRRRRGLAAEELGIPSLSTARTAGGIPKTMPAPTEPRVDGRILALAARGHEGAVEEALPKGSPMARVQGVFTHAVAAALMAGARDLASLREAVDTTYRAAGRLSPVPLMRGAGQLTLLQASSEARSR